MDVPPPAVEPSPSGADAIEATRMSLGDHLEELRKRLGLALGVLLLALIPSLILGDTLLDWLVGPLQAAMATPAGPGVTRCAPAHGAAAGGTVVTLTLRDFDAPPATVFFGERAARVRPGATLAAVVVESPPGRGPTAVTVLDATGRSAAAAFHYDETPVPAGAAAIEVVAPPAGSGDGGVEVVLEGHAIGASAPLVLFGAEPARVRSHAPGRVVVLAPRGSGTVTVQALTAGTPAAAAAFTFVAGARRPLLIANQPGEQFVVYLEASLVVAIVATSPVTFWILWGFVAAGLYPHERRWIRFFAPATLACFLGGVGFLYFVMLPVVLRFLLTFWEHDFFTPSMSLAAYATFFLWMSVLMGLIFLTPLVMSFLALVGLVSARGFSGGRRYVILAAFVVAAVLTPPEVASQLMMAVPFLLLYEFGIGCARLIERHRRRSGSV